MGWKMKYADISAAFLQGEKLQEERVVYIRLPRGYPEEVQRHLLQRLREGRPGTTNLRMDIVRMVKGGFGLAESPHLRLRRGLLEIGMSELKLSPGTFILHVNGTLAGILAIHVGDLRMAFHPEAECVLERLRETFHLAFGISKVQQMAGARDPGTPGSSTSWSARPASPMRWCSRSSPAPWKTS